MMNKMICLILHAKLVWIRRIAVRACILPTNKKIDIFKQYIANTRWSVHSDNADKEKCQISAYLNLIGE